MYGNKRDPSFHVQKILKKEDRGKNLEEAQEGKEREEMEEIVEVSAARISRSGSEVEPYCWL